MKQLEEILIVDVEATCWDGKTPEGVESDVIEIGVCKLKIETGEISQKQSIYIKPSRSTISEFCTELTGITPETVENQGVSFEEACGKLNEQYNSKKIIWASYGEYDRNILQKHCRDFNVEYPFSQVHLNVKVLFALKQKWKTAPGLMSAVLTLGYEFEGKHHSGADDAYNIAKVLLWILND